MLDVKSLLAKITSYLNNTEQTKTYKSSTSFANAYPDSLSHTLRFLGTALDSVNSNIGSYNTGMIHVASGGPVYGIALFKYTNSYYGGFVMTYLQGAPIVAFSYYNGTRSITIHGVGGVLHSSIFKAFMPHREVVGAC